MIANFTSWVERRNFISVRAFVLYVTVWMTWEISIKAFAFAYASKFDGTGTAMVLGAITMPFAALQAFVFKFYLESKQ